MYDTALITQGEELTCVHTSPSHVELGAHTSKSYKSWPLKL